MIAQESTALAETAPRKARAAKALAKTERLGSFAVQIYDASACLSCVDVDSGIRYHVWTDHKLEITEWAVFMRCSAKLVITDRGFFEARTMDGSRGKGQRVRDALIAASPVLLRQALDIRAAKKAAQRQQMLAAELLGKVHAAGPQLLQLVRDAAALVNPDTQAGADWLARAVEAIGPLEA